MQKKKVVWKQTQADYNLILVTNQKFNPCSFKKHLC